MFDDLLQYAPLAIIVLLIASIAVALWVKYPEKRPKFITDRLPKPGNKGGGEEKATFVALAVNVLYQVFVRFAWRLICKTTIVGGLKGLVNRWPLLFTRWEHESEDGRAMVISPVWREIRGNEDQSKRPRHVWQYHRYDATDWVEKAIAFFGMILGFTVVTYVLKVQGFSIHYMTIGTVLAVTMLAINGRDKDSHIFESLFYWGLCVYSIAVWAPQVTHMADTIALVDTADIDGYHMVFGGIGVLVFQWLILPLTRYQQERSLSSVKLNGRRNVAEVPAAQPVTVQSNGHREDDLPPTVEAPAATVPELNYLDPDEEDPDRTAELHAMYIEDDDEDGDEQYDGEHERPSVDSIFAEMGR